MAFATPITSCVTFIATNLSKVGLISLRFLQRKAKSQKKSKAYFVYNLGIVIIDMPYVTKKYRFNG